MHRHRRRYSQNFLIDPVYIEQVIQAINPWPQQPLIEIGPGSGTLTRPVLATASHLTVIEIDYELSNQLQKELGNRSNFSLIQGDALKQDYAELAADQPVKIFGNLPYHISTPLLQHLFSAGTRISEMIFMLQKEVVQRLAATSGTAAYGRLSLLARYYCKVEPLFDIPPQAFDPQPRVWSSMVRLMPQPDPPYDVGDKNCFFEIVRQAFSQRRKTLKNSLGKLVDLQKMSSLAQFSNQRAEQLDFEDYAHISRVMHHS